MMTMTTKNMVLDTFKEHWTLFLLWGLALVVLGFIALGVASFTTLISVIFLGTLILIGGIVLVVDAFKFWWGNWSVFFLHLVVGILYVIVGFMLIENPVYAAASITLILGIFYVALGIFRLINAIVSRLPNWGFTLFNGIIALLLGILILAHWPDSSLFIIGVFVGIDLIVSGFTYMMLALSARRFTKV